MSKVLAILTAVGILVIGCASSNPGLITQLDTTIGQATDTVWKQKDCRAGLLKSQIDVRQVSIETRTSIETLVKLANTESEEFKKCYYFGNVFNAYLFASKDIVAANTQLINMLMGLVK